MAEIRRPTGLGEDEWEAISDAEERLLRAKAANDTALVVGSAKELCESIAKVVIAERGGAAESTAEFAELVGAAHRALEFQPGVGLGQDPATRRVAQGLKSLVLGVGEVRNRYGTGHGRAAPSGIADEHADLAFDAATMWAAWALRRLEPYIAGNITQLVRDLEGTTFYSGTLARRLEFADLRRQPPEDRMRLGVAVARRASRGTFVVTQDGIEAVDPDDRNNWPPEYIHGLSIGLFFDANGFLTIEPWKVRACERLLSGLSDPLPVLQDLADRTRRAAADRSLATSDENRADVLDAFDRTLAAFPDGEARDHWEAIASAVRTADGDHADG